MGTMHLPATDYPEYAGKLGDLIEEIAPDIICSELSPEQLTGTQPCNSKPEQRDVVMPTAKRLGILIVPIQPDTEVGTEWEKTYKAAEQELRTDIKGRHFLDFSSFLSGQEAELCKQYMKSADCIENIQMNEYHIFAEARDVMDEKWMPQLARLLTEWNEQFLSKIVETIESNPGRLIMVITGLWHKHWLWKKLEHTDGIAVHNLHTFRLSGKKRNC